MVAPGCEADRGCRLCPGGLDRALLYHAPVQRGSPQPANFCSGASQWTMGDLSLCTRRDPA